MPESLRFPHQAFRRRMRPVLLVVVGLAVVPQGYGWAQSGPLVLPQLEEPAQAARPSSTPVRPGAPARAASGVDPSRVEGLNPAARPAPARREPTARPKPPAPPRAASSAPAAKAPAPSAQALPGGALPAPGHAQPEAATAPTAGPSPSRTGPSRPAGRTAPAAAGQAATPAQATAAPKTTSAIPPAPPPLTKEPPPPLTAPDTSDVAAILDRRRVATHSPDLLPAQATARPGQPVPIRLQKAPRPLYAADLLSPPRISVHDTTLQAPDPGEAAPVALNSFEAVKIGLPAGPYRAGLIEEIESDPDRPRIEGGTVMWTTIPGDDPSPDAPPAALTAEVTLDAPGSRAKITLRPVREPGMPPTVAMEVEFTGPLAAVTRVGLPELRNAGVDRGIPLFGVVSAQDGVFRVTLAREQTDGEQNVRLLMTRPWIDLPMRLQDGRRVIVAFEKGTAVREMMRSALRLWRMPWLP